MHQWMACASSLYEMEMKPTSSTNWGIVHMASSIVKFITMTHVFTNYRNLQPLAYSSYAQCGSPLDYGTRPANCTAAHKLCTPSVRTSSSLSALDPNLSMLRAMHDTLLKQQILANQATHDILMSCTWMHMLARTRRTTTKPEDGWSNRHTKTQPIIYNHGITLSPCRSHYRIELCVRRRSKSHPTHDLMNLTFWRQHGVCILCITHYMNIELTCAHQKITCPSVRIAFWIISAQHVSVEHNGCTVGHLS
jgi:hypothetical protein